VSTTVIHPQTLRPTFSAFGKLESNRVARLRSDLAAEIDAVYVQEGDWVETGAPLVHLDDREAKLRILEQAAELEQQQTNLKSMQSELALAKETEALFKSRHEVAQSKLRRHQDLIARSLISTSLPDEVTSLANQASIEYRNQVRVLADLPNHLSASEANAVRAQALLDRAQLNLDKTNITAPFAGSILAVHAAPGDYNSLSTPLIEIAALEGFEVRVQTPDAFTDTFMQVIRNGQTVTATADANAELQLQRLAGQVKPGQTGLDAFFAFAPGAEMPPLGKVFNLKIALTAKEHLVA